MSAQRRVWVSKNVAEDHLFLPGSIYEVEISNLYLSSNAGMSVADYFYEY